MHFASRGAMDIEGMGQAVVEQLVRKKLVKDLAGIYSLKKEELLKLDLFAKKKAEGLIAATEKSKKQPLSRLLFALGIRHVGEKAAFVLASRFGNIDKLTQAGKDDLQGISEIGPIMASAVVDFFSSPEAKRLIKDLREAGLNMPEPTIKRRAQNLAGKAFVFTGELESFSRNDAQRLVQELGANLSSIVSKNTDFVVAGDNPGSKYAKAKKLGLKIIDEAAFKRMIK
jgi:DNA ligase (NAD+)